MDVQLIEKDNAKWALIPYDDYLSLVELAELAIDMTSDTNTKEKVAPEVVQLPEELRARLLGGENAIRIWREFRRLTLAELAKRAGVTESFVALVERGRQPAGSTSSSALPKRSGCIWNRSSSATDKHGARRAALVWPNSSHQDAFEFWKNQSPSALIESGGLK